LQLLHCLAALASEGVHVDVARLFEGRRVERANLRRLARPEQKLAPGTWLIDGGQARPAEAPPQVLRPVPATASQPQSSPPAAARVAAPAPVAASAPVAAAPPVAPAPSSPAPSQLPARHTHLTRPVINPSIEEQTPVTDPGNGYHAPSPPDRVADVMARYQQLMQQFLETERAVMLGYLGAAGGSVAAPARASIPAPALMAPAPAAPPQLAPPAP